MIKLELNKEAFTLLAKELRMASWGASVITATIVFNNESGLSLVVGSLTWIVLQGFGFLAATIKISKRK